MPHASWAFLLKTFLDTRIDDILNPAEQIAKDTWGRLMCERRIEETVPIEIVADGCLLCSEDKPHHCHRRLVAEYLKHRWDTVEIVHLG